MGVVPRGGVGVVPKEWGGVRVGWWDGGGATCQRTAPVLPFRSALAGLEPGVLLVDDVEMSPTPHDLRAGLHLQSTDGCSNLHDHLLLRNVIILFGCGRVERTS